MNRKYLTKRKDRSSIKLNFTYRKEKRGYSVRLVKNFSKREGGAMGRMAELLGISESYYCLIENGKRQKRIDIFLLSRLSDVLEKPIIELIKLEAQQVHK